jgi:hypothetical protein
MPFSISRFPVHVPKGIMVSAQPVRRQVKGSINIGYMVVIVPVFGEEVFRSIISIDLKVWQRENTKATIGGWRHEHASWLCSLAYLQMVFTLDGEHAGQLAPLSLPDGGSDVSRMR